MVAFSLSHHNCQKTENKPFPAGIARTLPFRVRMRKNERVKFSDCE